MIPYTVFILKPLRHKHMLMLGYESKQSLEMISADKEADMFVLIRTR